MRPLPTRSSALPSALPSAEPTGGAAEALAALPPVLVREGEVPRLYRVEPMPGGAMLRPVGGFARISGEVPIPIGPEQLSELQLAGPELLLMRLGGRSLRVEGEAAEALGRWLAEAMGMEVEQAALLEGEVRCWGPTGPTGRVARLSLSLGGLRRGGLHRGGPSRGGLSLRDGRRSLWVPLEDIVEMDVLAPSLRVELLLLAADGPREPAAGPSAGLDEGGWCTLAPSGQRRLSLGGGLALGLYAALSRILHGEGAPPVCLAAWPAPRLDGASGAGREGVAPATAPGVLRLTTEGLEWRPAAAASPPLRLRWASLERAVVHGVGQPRLSVVASHGGLDRQIYSFMVEDPAGVLRALTEALHQAQRAFAAEVGRGERAADQIRGRWAAIRSAPAPAVKLQGLALRAVGLDVSVGLVVLAHDRLWFLPAGGPSGTAGADDWACADLLRRAEPDPEGLPSVRFEAEGRPFRLITAADEVFVGRFWDRCRTPTRIVRGARAVALSLARMEGQPRQLRVRGPDGAVSVRQPGLLVGLDRGIGLLLDEALPPMSAGAVVAVEVARQEGIYEFLAVVVELRRLAGRALAAAGLPVAAEEEHRLVVVACPAELRLYNQRRSFRVSVDLEAQAILGPQPAHGHRRLPLRVDDLSTGGCGAWGAGALEVGMNLELLLQLPERSVQAAARVLRADPGPDGAPERRRYGLCFEGLSVGDEERIHRVVLATQGAALQAQAAQKA